MPKWDSRLIGTWKSDRRRTFRHYKPRVGFEPQKLRKLKSLFGQLTLRWGRGVCHTEFDGHREVAHYEIIARDSRSVIIRHWSEIFMEYQVSQIHFEGEFYFIALGGGMCEYFKRVKGS